MTIRNFRPITGVDFEAPAMLLKNSGESYNAGFNALNQAIQGQQKRIAGQELEQTKKNDLAIQANLEKFNTLAELKQAQQAGTFDLSNRQAQFGDRYSQDKATAAYTAKEALLRDSAYNEAVGVGVGMANTSQDTTKGVSAMGERLRTLGMSPAEILKRQAQASQGMQALQPGYDKQKQESSNTAFNNIIESGKSINTVKERNALLADLDPNIRSIVAGKLKNVDTEQDKETAQTTKEKRETETYNRRMQELSPEKRRQYDYLNQTGQARIAQNTAEGMQKLDSIQRNIEALPNPVEEGVSNQLKNILDSGSSVIEYFSKEIEQGWSKGSVNGLFNMFGDVTTGTAAMELVKQKMKDLTKDDRLSDNDAAAIAIQSYKFTYADNDIFLGPGINERSWDEDIERRTNLLAKKREMQKEFQTTKQALGKENTSLEQINRDTLFNFTDTGKLPVKESKLPVVSSIDPKAQNKLNAVFDKKINAIDTKKVIDTDEDKALIKEFKNSIISNYGGI